MKSVTMGQPAVQYRLGWEEEKPLACIGGICADMRDGAVAKVK